MQCCGGGGFDQGFRRLLEEIFPESENRLLPLSADHPVWFAEEKVAFRYLPELWGIEVSCRTGVIYCPYDLSCYWELARVGREGKYCQVVQEQIRAAQAVGLNVLTYATNREVQYKNPGLPVAQTAEPTGTFERGTLYVANVLHPGGYKSFTTSSSDDSCHIFDWMASRISASH